VHDDPGLEAEAVELLDQLEVAEGETERPER
jgi:hypothetical protein